MSNENVLAGFNVISDPKLYELLYKIVSEAQASGSTVIITTIIPPFHSGVDDGMRQIESCMPKDVSCPK